MGKESDAPRDIDRNGVPYTVFSGFCMGTADVVPGVSGGTMAVALGIYHQLLAAISSVNGMAAKKALKFRLREAWSLVHWKFLFSLAAGIGTGIVLMVKVVKLPSMVLDGAPERESVYAIFFGMVLASTVIVGRQVRKWSAVGAGALLAGAAIGFAVVNLVPRNTPTHPLFIFACGTIAICAMLLPGISGSFILLILRKYAYILGAVGSLQFGVLLPFAAGCAVGLLGFSRLLNWLLSRWHDTVLALLVGLLFGSLWRIWPYQTLEEVTVRDKRRVVAAAPHLPESFEFRIVLLMVAGIVFVLAVEWYAARRRAREGAAHASAKAKGSS